MKAREDMVLRQIGESWYIFPIGQALARKQRVLKMNEVGAFLYGLLGEEQTVESLIENVLKDYDIDEATAKNVVVGFVNNMIASGLVRG